MHPLDVIEFLALDLHDSVASDQQEVQFLAATETLNDPSAQAKHMVDPSCEAKVPAGQGKQRASDDRVAPAQQ
jgi:hypothetical protein